MPHYLYQVKYTPESWAALTKNPENRRETIGRLIEKLGGKLQELYFAFGDVDVFAIATFPDDTTAGAVSVAVASSGAVKSITTTTLLTAEEGMQLMKKAASVDYAKPGSRTPAGVR